MGTCVKKLVLKSSVEVTEKVAREREFVGRRWGVVGVCHLTHRMWWPAASGGGTFIGGGPTVVVGDRMV